MPLIYDRALNQFIFYPLKASTNRQPKINKAGNKSFYTAPKIPNTIRANNRAKPQPFIQQINKLALLLVVGGWIGILIYYFYYPISFSLIELALYLAIQGCTYVLTNVFIYKYEFENRDILHADLVARGKFFRDIKRALQKRLPNLKLLFYEKYDCTKIRLDSNFDKIRFCDSKVQVKILAYLIAAEPEVRYRWKYKDPKIQTFLEKHQ